MKRSHDALLAGPAAATRHSPFATPSVTDPSSSPAPTTMTALTTASSVTTAASEVPSSPAEKAQKPRPEALVAADRWLTRQQALQWLSAADELAGLNAAAQQQMCLASPSISSVPSAADYFGNSPAGYFSVASPMSSVPATPATPLMYAASPAPLMPSQAATPATPADVADCYQSHHGASLDADHTLEFEIQRDMGMVWREQKQPLDSRGGVDGLLSPPPRPPMTPMMPIGSPPAPLMPMRVPGVDHGAPIMFSDGPRNGFVPYPPPEWTNSGGRMYTMPYNDGAGFMPRSAPYGTGPAMQSARPPSAAQPLRAPMYTYDEWNRYLPPIHESRQGQQSDHHGYYDSPM